MDPTELPLEQVDVIFSRLKKLGVKRLGLLGGEPLLRRDILDIIALAKAKGFFISLNTNLLLYQKYKNDLENVDLFFTSLDGTPEKHEANRGKQSYDKILTAIRHIVAQGKRVIAICVVTEPEIATADYLLNLAKEENILIHFQPECYDAENVLRSAPDDVNQEGKKSEIRQFWKYLTEQKIAGAPISSSLAYLKYISQWQDYSHTAVYDPAEKCAAGSGFLYVDPVGNAYPCVYVNGTVKGVNLLKDNWNENFNKTTPCTKCIVGPYLEFNLLFKKPVPSLMSAIKNM
jgi:MoaA/NifB/PqqE/SkfB family radical SAM enzyme